MRKVSLKISRVGRKYGCALIPKLVSYFRRPDNGSPTHLVLKDFGTIRDYQKTDETIRRKLWLAFSLELMRLKTTKRIGSADVDRLCSALEKEFPKVGLVTKPEPKPDQTTREELIAKFPFLARVREGA